MPKIRLYGYATSPFVRKTAAFLYFKQLEFEHVPVNPADPTETIGHTGGTQVPVLEVDGEWRTESSEHALWLDELYPERPLCEPEHGDQILEIDRWVSDFLHAGFRAITEGPMSAQMRMYLWRMAEIVNAHTPLPDEIRNSWPELVREAPFIRAMVDRMNLEESYPDMETRYGLELIARLGDGPFLGGLAKPSMADLALFPNIAFSFMVGLADEPEVARVAPLMAWFNRLASLLPENPILVRDFFIVNPLKRA